MAANSKRILHDSLNSGNFLKIMAEIMFLIQKIRIILDVMAPASHSFIRKNESLTGNNISKAKYSVYLPATRTEKGLPNTDMMTFLSISNLKETLKSTYNNGKISSI